MISTQRYVIETKAIGIYGVRNQLIKAVEVMSELTKEITKYLTATRAGEYEEKAVADMLEETADVQIMLDQIRLIFGKTDKIEAKKLERLQERLETLNV